MFAKGKETYHKANNRLMNNDTWRDRWTSIIIFNKTVHLSTIIDQLESIIQEHDILPVILSTFDNDLYPRHYKINQPFYTIQILRLSSRMLNIPLFFLKYRFTVRRCWAVFQFLIIVSRISLTSNQSSSLPSVSAFKSNAFNPGTAGRSIMAYSHNMHIVFIQLLVTVDF